MDEVNPDPNSIQNPPNNPGELKRVLEAVLLSSQQALSVFELRKVFVEEIGTDVLRVLLDELREEWSGQPVELLQLASGWRFRTRPEYLPYLERLNPEKPPKYSRAVLETLPDLPSATGKYLSRHTRWSSKREGWWLWSAPCARR